MIVLFHKLVLIRQINFATVCNGICIKISFLDLLIEIFIKIPDS